MRSARIASAAALAALLLAAAGCGGDGEGGDTTGASTQPAGTRETAPPKQDQGEGQGQPVGDRVGRAAADAFVACFTLDGYKAELLGADGTGAPFASIANGSGYRIAAVNVPKEGTVVGSANVTFFESEAKRKEAMDELGVYFKGDDAAGVRGVAVVDYLSVEDRKATESAIDACLR